ncbi:MAG: D-aminoacylase [Gemmatimonadota bacterium]
MRFRQLLLAGAVLGAACSREPAAMTTVILGATVYDGSGLPGVVADVRLAGSRIVAIGNLVPKSGEWVFNAEGMALAPGFIDTHSHADRGIFDDPSALAAVSQGITTVVVGNDGGSPYPLADFYSRLDSAPAAINLASYAGHGSLRQQVMGDDYRRVATQVEVDSMKSLLYRELDAGALGLSTGLEYDPGIYSDYQELLHLTQATSAEGGRYISHIRSEDRDFWPAIDEIIRLGRDAGIPVQISHIKLAMRSLWGKADSLIALLDAARASGVEITADIYPYPYWQSGMTVLFPERSFSDKAAAHFALREIATPEDIRISAFDLEPSYVGKTLAEVARSRGSDPATTLLALIREVEAAEAAGRPANETIIATSMRTSDIDRLVQWEWTNICTDGELDGQHPRGFGAFAKVLGDMARQREVLTMGEAIRKMTSLPARNMGLADRGYIREQAVADLVLFDPELVADQATLADPHRPAAGIVSVWVAGELVYDRGQATGKRPGTVIRRGH